MWIRGQGQGWKEEEGMEMMTQTQMHVFFLLAGRGVSSRVEGPEEGWTKGEGE